MALLLFVLGQVGSADADYDAYPGAPMVANTAPRITPARVKTFRAKLRRGLMIGTPAVAHHTRADEGVQFFP
jgi:hypothetical protein